MVFMIFLNIVYIIWQCGSLLGCIELFQSGNIIPLIIVLIVFPIGGGLFLGYYFQFKMTKEFLISRLENAKGKEYFSYIYNKVRFDDLQITLSLKK